MKKEKVPSLKELEKTIAEWKSVGPERVALVKSRNEKVRTQREKKDARFTARVRTDDFNRLKRIAEEKRIPYQTLLGSIIHGYV